MQKLSKKEVELVVDKIKDKYKKIIVDFKKPETILEAFSTRYITALKAHLDISMFLLAEIEAVDEIYKNEEKKQVEQKNRKNLKKGQSVADRIFEENLQRIKKYPRIRLTDEGDEDVEYLCGAIREFIIIHWPVITHIFQENRQSRAALKVNEYHHALISLYDTKGAVPIARHYVTALGLRPVNFKKADFEYRRILQETGFLLNDIMKLFKGVSRENSLPWPDRKVIFQNVRLIRPEVKKLFSGKTYGFCFDLVYTKLEDILADFRLKDFKRKVI